MSTRKGGGEKRRKKSKNDRFYLNGDKKYELRPCMFRNKFKNQLVLPFLVLELGLTKTVNELQPQFSYSDFRYSSNKNDHM